MISRNGRKGRQGTIKEKRPMEPSGKGKMKNEE
jgi:hypothetical protein